MYVTNTIDDYDKLTSSNYTEMTLSNCTNNENNIEIIMPLFTRTPLGKSLMCLISLIVYILTEPLFNNK